MCKMYISPDSEDYLTVSLAVRCLVYPQLVVTDNH